MFNRIDSPQIMTTSKNSVPHDKVANWTAVWVVSMLMLLFAPWIAQSMDMRISPLSHSTYLILRTVGILILIAFFAYGLGVAWRYIGGDATDSWYTNALLVFLVLFWALFPPSWFFLEYFLFDHEIIKLPLDLKCQADGGNIDCAKQTLKATYLAETKVYADLASKVWGAVGASLGATIAVAKRVP
jgi:hypothetical protein